MRRKRRFRKGPCKPPAIPLYHTTQALLPFPKTKGRVGDAPSVGVNMALGSFCSANSWLFRLPTESLPVDERLKPGLLRCIIESVTLVALDLRRLPALSASSEPSCGAWGLCPPGGGSGGRLLPGRADVALGGLVLRSGMLDGSRLPVLSLGKREGCAVGGEGWPSRLDRRGGVMAPSAIRWRSSSDIGSADIRRLPMLTVPGRTLGECMRACHTCHTGGRGQQGGSEGDTKHMLPREVMAQRTIELWEEKRLVLWLMAALARRWSRAATGPFGGACSRARRI